jgi:hypothetical protein
MRAAIAIVSVTARAMKKIVRKETFLALNATEDPSGDDASSY